MKIKVHLSVLKEIINYGPMEKKYFLKENRNRYSRKKDFRKIKNGGSYYIRKNNSFLLR